MTRFFIGMALLHFAAGVLLLGTLPALMDRWRQRKLDREAGKPHRIRRAGGF